MKIVSEHVGVKRSIYDRLLSGGSWAFAGKLFGGLSGLLVSATLSHLLSIAELGSFFLASSMVGIGVLVAQFGLNQAALGMVSRAIGDGQPEKAKAVVMKVVLLGAIGAITVAIVLFLGLGEWTALVVLKSSLTASIVSLLAAWVVVQSLQNILAEIFRGYRDIRFATLMGGIASGALFLLIIGIIFFVNIHVSLRHVIGIVIGSVCTAAIGGGIILWQRLREIQKIQIATKDVLIVAFPLFVSSIAYFITQADLWIVSAFRPPEEVAIYGAATRLVLLVSMPLLLVNAVIPPILAELYVHSDHHALQNLLRATATLGGIPAIIMLIVFMIWGSDLLGLIYGAAYREGSLILILLGLGQFVNVWTGSCGYMLLMAGRQNIIMIIQVVCALMTLMLAINLVKHYGDTGVALAVMMGTAIQNVSMLIAVKRELGIWTHADLCHISSFVNAIRKA